MKLVFAGTPEFAVPPLKQLIASKHCIEMVLTQPDRPAGRGRQSRASAIKQIAMQHDLTVWQPGSLKNPEIQQSILDLQADAIIVVAYGLMRPPALLTQPRFGCINIHPSLLPRWRGPTPIQTSLLHGDTETGVSIMRLDEGMDTGPIYAQCHYPIPPDSTSEDLHDTLAKLGAEQLIQTLNQLAQEPIQPYPQNDEQATLTRKIKKTDGLIHWEQNATTIANQIRAFTPWPVCYTHINNQTVRIWEAHALVDGNEKKCHPGTVINFTKHGLDIACADGALRITQLQLPGSKRALAIDFYNAQKNRITPASTVCCSQNDA